MQPTYTNNSSHFGILGHRKKRKRQRQPQQQNMRRKHGRAESERQESESDNDMFDPALLEQIAKDEVQEQQERAKPQPKRHGSIEPGFKGKHTLFDGTRGKAESPAEDRIRLFRDYHMRAQVLKENDRLSKRNYIDPKLRQWMQRHFYDGNIIKRVPTVQWHSEKRSFVGPSKQFSVESSSSSSSSKSPNSTFQIFG